MGNPPLAIMMGVQQRKGLRPSEMTAITPENVYVSPGNDGSDALAGSVILKLAEKTKSGRSQVAVFRPGEAPGLRRRLLRLKRHTGARQPVCRVTQV